MREVDIDGTKLHFAKNEKEWRKEIEKKYPYVGANEIHHIVEVGRVPKLRYCVENGVKIPKGIHIKQKSLDYEERVWFQKFIRSITEKDIWTVLKKIEMVSRTDPKLTKLVGDWQL